MTIFLIIFFPVYIFKFNQVRIRGKQELDYNPNEVKVIEPVTQKRKFYVRDYEMRCLTKSCSDLVTLDSDRSRDILYIEQKLIHRKTKTKSVQKLQSTAIISVKTACKRIMQLSSFNDKYCK